MNTITDARPRGGLVKSLPPPADVNGDAWLASSARWHASGRFFARWRAADSARAALRADKPGMNDQLDDVIKDAISAHPQPTDTGAGVRAEVLELTPPPDADAAPRVSRKGETWDARIHESPPIETCRGTWKKLRSAPELVLQAVVDTGPDDVARNQCDFVFQTVTPALDVTFPLPDASGKTWAPSDAERTGIEKALARFYRHHPEYMIDLPPGLGLIAAVAFYALPRAAALPAAQKLLKRAVNGKRAPRATVQAHLHDTPFADGEAMRDAA